MMERNSETSSAIGGGQQYVSAEKVNVPQNSTTVSSSEKVRLVVTKRNEGTLQLRYAPQEPKRESPDTSS